MFQRLVHRCFHPLSGFSSYLSVYQELIGLSEEVSIPCRGFLLIYNYKFSHRHCRNKCPSPVGVFFHIYNCSLNIKTKYLMCPSPVGVFFLFILPFVSHYLSLFQMSIACEMNLSLLFNDNTLQNSLQPSCNVHRVKTNQLSYIIPSGKDFPNNMYTSMYAVILPVLHHLY